MISIATEGRCAFRRLLKSPGHSCATILSLALGVGFSTAIFSLIYFLLFRDLPINRPEQLVQLTVRSSPKDQLSQNFVFLPGGYYDFLGLQHDVLSGTCAWNRWDLNGRTAPFQAVTLSLDCFDTLKLKPIAGRLPGADEDRVGGEGDTYPLVLSYNYWTAWYRQDPNAIGQKLTFDGKSFTIVGVLEKGFDGLQLGEVPSAFIPSSAVGVEERHGNRIGSWMIFCRLRDGVRLKQATDWLRPRFSDWVRGAPHFHRMEARSGGIDIVVSPARTGYSPVGERYRGPLFLLQVLVILIVFLSSTYLAMLTSSKLRVRRHDIAIQFALGATRWDVVRPLIIEACFVTTIGGFGAWAVAFSTYQYLTWYISHQEGPIDLPHGPGIIAFLFGIGLSIIAMFGFGLIPILINSTVDPSRDLREISLAGIGIGRRLIARPILVVFQSALSLVVVSIAVQIATGLVDLMTKDVGFRTTNTMFFTLDVKAYSSGSNQQLLLLNSLLERIKANPYSAKASASQTHPLLGQKFTEDVTSHLLTGQTRHDASMNEISIASGYFDTLGIRFLRGSDFNSDDILKRAQKAILSRSAAGYLYGEADPLGQTIVVTDGTPLQVVGVVNDSKSSSLKSSPPRTIYLPISFGAWGGRLPEIDLAVEASLPIGMNAEIQNLIHEQMPEARLLKTETIQQLIRDSIGRERFLASLSTSFAGFSLLLAILGLYGVINYSITIRKSEFSIRLALGETRFGLLSLVIRESLMIVVPGLVVGIIASWVAGRYVYSVLPNVEPVNIFVLVLSLGLLFGSTFLASLFPAWSASRTDPMTTLRGE